MSDMNFDDLEGDFDNIPTKRDRTSGPGAKTVTWSNPCPKCQGRGKFLSNVTGRVVGDCFTCKGKGVLEFKTAPSTREKARVNYAERKERTAAGNTEAFAAGHPVEWKWIGEASARGFEFATSMRDAVAKFGSLTDKQLAAVQRCVERDQQRQASWAQERAQKAEMAAGLDLSKISELFANVRSNGAKKATLHFNGLQLSLAKEHSQNPGAVYAKRTSDGAYLGKLLGGAFKPTREATQDDLDRLQKANADPLGEAVRYGTDTDRCACCNAQLTDPVSKARKIGPICASKWGL